LPRSAQARFVIDDAIMSELTVVPANEARWEDIQAVFGTRGVAPVCQCQRYKLARREAFASFPPQERAARLRAQTDAGHPGAEHTSGLVAYRGDEPAGWCNVEPRTHFQGLIRNNRIPWMGRDEDKADDTVWALTCLFTRAGHRGRGVSYALARAAVDFARERGARALEGYPIFAPAGARISWDEIHVGSPSVFLAAGFTEVSRPSPRRAVMRIDFGRGA
jgi:GNAT superfamily N-acetyltransferase